MHRFAAPALAFALAAACDPPARTPAPSAPPPAPASASPPASTRQAPAAISARDLRGLRWIEGSWRGAGGGQAPFYERYRFADDSTLVVDSFADSTLSAATESTRFELRGGRLGNASTTVRWAASRLDARSVTFVPEVGARNSFIWRYESPDRWTALLSWPASDTRPAREAVYHMERVR